MKLLQQAPVIAFLSHLITVSAMKHYVCPFSARFTEAEINQFRNEVIERRATSLQVYGMHDGAPLYEIRQQTVGEETHYFLLKVNLSTGHFQVVEKNNDGFHECRLQ
ncbi:BgTH12-07679 [Blumeria graminis f. sp. triticale]|uniref:BgtE-20008 n=3 Tax=Blumeria graminis TaxID=34373 RepID=A0A381L031_BLUGR|nr:BgTH12-07679 [Blumeria graminis f. sp. triticale]VCU40764.1 BgtE-20008 [Blumeria graminis f. sp. tritici]